MVLSSVFTPYVSLVCSNLYSIGSKRMQVQGDLCLPVCKHQVQAIERHARWANRAISAISSAPNVQPSTANWPLPFLAGVATPSFTKQCENLKSAAKAFRLASGSYSIETYRICSKFSIRSLETQKKAGMGTYLWS